MRPLKNRVLAVLIPEVVKEGEENVKSDKPLRAKVLAVGPDVKDITLKDTIVFANFGFDTVDDNIIISDDLIIAAYEEEKDK